MKTHACDQLYSTSVSLLKLSTIFSGSPGWLDREDAVRPADHCRRPGGPSGPARAPTTAAHQGRTAAGWSDTIPILSQYLLNISLFSTAQQQQQQQAGIQKVVINQPGTRPGQPGSQITVPLATLQALQAGQGIPTGQPGHLLVKTETGQYQILRVGPPGPQATATSAATPPSSAAAPARPSPPVPVSLPTRPSLPVAPARPPVPQPRLPTQPVSRTPAPPATTTTPSSAARWDCFDVKGCSIKNIPFQNIELCEKC